MPVTNTHEHHHYRQTVGLVLAALLLTALRAEAAPPKVTGFGCYANYDDIGGLANWRAHVELMKDAGMNTFAVYARNEVDLQEQIDIAVEAGMLEKSIPVFVISNAGPAVYARVTPHWQDVVRRDTSPPSGFAPGDLAGFAAMLRAAKRLARQGDRWPELIAYSYDEPGNGDLKWAGHKLVGQITAGYRAQGFRCGTAVCWPHTRDLIPHLDVLAYNLIIGGDMKTFKEAVTKAGKPWWVYNVHLRQSTPAAIRWHVGVWTWLAQPECRLEWSWGEFVGKQADMAHPVMNDRLQAYAEGVRQYEALRASEAWMAEQRDDWNWEGQAVEQFTTTTDWKVWEPPPLWFPLLPR